MGRNLSKHGYYFVFWRLGTSAYNDHDADACCLCQPLSLTSWWSPWSHVCVFYGVITREVTCAHIPTATRAHWESAPADKDTFLYTVKCRWRELLLVFFANSPLRTGTSESGFLKFEKWKVKIKSFHSFSRSAKWKKMLSLFFEKCKVKKNAFTLFREVKSEIRMLEVENEKWKFSRICNNSQETRFLNRFILWKPNKISLPVSTYLRFEIENEKWKWKKIFENSRETRISLVSASTHIFLNFIKYERIVTATEKWANCWNNQRWPSSPSTGPRSLMSAPGGPVSYLRPLTC